MAKGSFFAVEFTDYHFQTKNYQNPLGHAYQGAAGFNLGGRSVFWGAIIPRPSWWELDSWPTDLRYEMEDTYFTQAEDLMKLLYASGNNTEYSGISKCMGV